MGILKIPTGYDADRSSGSPNCWNKEKMASLIRLALLSSLFSFSLYFCILCCSHRLSNLALGENERTVQFSGETPSLVGNGSNCLKHWFFFALCLCFSQARWRVKRKWYWSSWIDLTNQIFFFSWVLKGSLYHVCSRSLTYRLNGAPRTNMIYIHKSSIYLGLGL
jgi:hypothetical protein